MLKVQTISETAGPGAAAALWPVRSMC